MKIVANKKLNLEKNTIIDINKIENKLILKYKEEILDELDFNFIYEELFKLRNNYKLRVIDDFNLEFVLFSDLHRHSGYSLLDGANTIESLVEKTEFSGALTDHGNMFGSLEYFKQMKNAGKKSLIGIEVYSENFYGEKDRNHLVLLAKNQKGFKNLIKLTSLSWKNIYYKPHVKYEWLKQYGEGIICLTGCLGGEIPKKIKENDLEGANTVLKALKDIFHDDLYVEVQRHNIECEKEINEALIKLAKDNNLKVVATTDSHYTNKEDDKIHEYLLCMQTGKTVNKPHFKFQGTNYHIHSSEEMMEIWKDNPEFVINTLEVEEKCEFEFDLGKTYMPKFDVPEGFKNEKEYFIYLCWKGFDERFKGSKEYDSEEYRERLQFEIDTINEMGFPGYFLIVWDYVNFAKNQGILVGPGRGSACGSLVAYCLKITDIEPIKYGLLFERFLNPSRVSLPDIDIDFTDTRRQEVIDYVIEKYGIECVSRIITFGTMASKAVIRDVGRVLDLPLSFVDKIAKAIPTAPKMTLDKALKESPTFLAMYQNDEEVKSLVDIAKKLEGLPKNMSVHACGVLIAKSPVDDYIPQVMMKDDLGEFVPTTQYNMAECEEMGILKMDFLGLRTLGVFDRALSYINKSRGENEEILTLENIPINDKNVYKYIATGKTYGIFQLESPGMTSFMKELFQDTLDDNCKVNGEQLFERLIAGISLYRPGPIDEIPNYIKNMLNPLQIKYDLPELEPILKSTYNVIVYQEQCMHIVRKLAGFSKGDADNVRKAFAKKKEKMVEELGKKFLYGEVDKNGKVLTMGCIKAGIPEELAKKIWEKMRKFGSYAFNKSHATGYAYICIKTAWLAYYYPVEFFTATLNSFIDAKGSASDKIKLYLSACRKLKINVLQPDINLSKESFSVCGNSIRFGLKGIKNMGTISNLIIKERDFSGRSSFSSFQNFVERMARYEKIESRVMEALIFSGSLDSFPKSRRAKLSVIPKLKNVASIEKKLSKSNQISIFDLASTYDEDINNQLNDIKTIDIPDLEEFDNELKLSKEKEFSGYYMTGNPLDDYEEYFETENVQEIGYLVNDGEDEFNDFDEFGEVLNIDDMDVTVAGILMDIKTIITKNNEIMYVGKVEDRTGTLNIVLYPKVAEKFGSICLNEQIVVLKGQLKNNENYGTQLIVSSAVDVKTLKFKEIPEKIIVIGNSFINKAREQFRAVRSVLNKTEKGNTEVIFVYGGKQYKVISDSIKHSYSLLCKLQNIVTERNVIIKYRK